MSIAVTCECGKKLRANEELAGKRVKCPACGAQLTISLPPPQKPTERTAPSAIDELMPPTVRPTASAAKPIAPQARPTLAAKPTASPARPKPPATKPTAPAARPTPPAPEPTSVSAQRTAGEGLNEASNNKELSSFLSSISTRHTKGIGEAKSVQVPSVEEKSSQGLPTDIPADLPKGEKWFDVALGNGEIKRLKSIEGVRDLILAGSVNRLSLARELFEEPTGTGESHAAELATWRLRTSWRPIGSGLLNDHYRIHVLYDPLGANIKYSVVIAAVIILVLAMIAVVILDNGSTLGSIYRHGLATSTPGQDGKVAIVSLGIYAIGMVAVSVTLAAAGGVPIGTAIGYLIYAATKRKTRRAPPDGMSAPFSWAPYATIAALCLVPIDIGFLVWGFHRESGFAGAMDSTEPGWRELQKGAPSATYALGNAFVDPKGRFTCRVPQGWRILEKEQDQRSNYMFRSDAVEIRIIARPTTASSAENITQMEMQAQMQKSLDQVKQRGGSGRVLGVYKERLNGTPVVRTELQIDSPKYSWIRQVKIIHNGVDHLIGLYVESPDKREPLVRLFDEFMKDYRIGT